MQQDGRAERADIPWESGTSTSDMGKKSINVSIYTRILCFCLLFLSPQELFQALKKKKKEKSRESKAYKSSVAIYVAFGVRMLRVPVSTASGVFFTQLSEPLNAA